MSEYDNTGQVDSAEPVVPAPAEWPPAQFAEQQQAPQPPVSGLPPWARWAIPGGALAFGLAVGVSLGVTALAADPTRSEEYRGLQVQSDDLAADVQDLEGRLERAEGRATTAESEASQAVASADSRQAELDRREQAVADREAAVTATEQRIADTSITQGIWTVGVDIEPGTYRTAEPLLGDCYWGIYASGTNGDDIIENDIPTGGYPTVTLSVGQDFENNGCGTFVKQ
jgi:hypothetical protein